MTNRYEYMKKYQQEHKEAFRIATQKYRDKDRKKYNEHNRMYQKRKREKNKENAELVIKYREILDKIKEKIQNELDNYNVTMGRAEKIELLELLEEINED